MAGRLQNLETWLKEIQDLDVEAILVHDKQDEETSVELASLLRALNSENIHFIEQTVNSPGLARNLGLQIAKGSWIQFVDSDDVVLVSDVLAAIHQSRDSTAIIGRFRWVNSDSNKRENSPEWTSTKRKNFRRLFVDPGLWRITLKMDFIQSKTFSELRLAEDILYLYSLDLVPEEICFVDAIHYEYFTNQESQLSQNPNTQYQLVEMLRRIETIPAKETLDVRGLIYARVLLSLLKRHEFSLLLTVTRLIVKNIKLSPNFLFSLLRALVSVAAYKFKKNCES